MKALAIKVFVVASFLAVSAALCACGKSPSEAAAATPVAAVSDGAKAVAPEPAPKPAPAVEKEDRVVVYYFHGDRRCPTCRGIQRTIEQTIDERFAAETLAGTVVYKEINTDQAEGRPFVEKFQLAFSTMVVVPMKGDKMLEWENCNKVWDFGTDAAKLSDYTAERIKAGLAKIEAR